MQFSNARFRATKSSVSLGEELCNSKDVTVRVRSTSLHAASLAISRGPRQVAKGTVHPFVLAHVSEDESVELAGAKAPSVLGGTHAHSPVRGSRSASSPSQASRPTWKRSFVLASSSAASRSAGDPARTCSASPCRRLSSPSNREAGWSAPKLSRSSSAAQPCRGAGGSLRRTQGRGARRWRSPCFARARSRGRRCCRGGCRPARRCRRAGRGRS